MSGAPATRAESVYRQLRTDILNGQLPAGSKLGFADIGQRYGVSTGVLREVLPRLVEQGLARSESQLGFRVVSVSVDDLIELTEARIAIETMVLRQSVVQGTLHWETDVVAAHHHLARTPIVSPDGRIDPEFVCVHARFHRVSLEGCPNSRLRDVANNLRDVAEVYRCWSWTPSTTHARDIPAEHRRIADAAIARDPDEAVTALTEHIQLTTDLLVASQRDVAQRNQPVDAA